MIDEAREDEYVDEEGMGVEGDELGWYELPFWLRFVLGSMLVMIGFMVFVMVMVLIVQFGKMAVEEIA